MGNATPVIAGSWREQSGKIWHSSQNGNTFTWTQEGSGRIATGSMVATSVTPGLSGWVIHMTFDGNVHWRLRPNSDGTVLHGLSDNFTRVSTGYGFVQPTVYNVFGMNSNVMANSSMNVQVLNSVYTENSGKTWIVNSNPHAGYFIMKNQQDGRQVECYVAKDLSNNRHVIYMQFQGTSAPLRGETFDIGQIQLSNGDCFRRTHNPTIITPVTPQPNYGISIGNSGLNISFTTPTTTIIPPQQQQPMYVNPNTSYMPPPQPFQQPQFQQPMMPPPQPFQQPYQQPYQQQSSVIITTTPSYGQTSNLANTIVNACQGKNFDKDKMHIVTTYSQSQVSPLSASDLVRVIAMFNFESDKEKVIKQLKQTNNIAGMDCNSAANIVRLFNHDSNKVNVIQDLCPFIFDRRQNAEVLIRYLSFSSSQNSVREYLFSH